MPHVEGFGTTLFLPFKGKVARVLMYTYVLCKCTKLEVKVREYIRMILLFSCQLIVKGTLRSWGVAFSL